MAYTFLFGTGIEHGTLASPLSSSRCAVNTDRKHTGSYSARLAGQSSPGSDAWLQYSFSGGGAYIDLAFWINHQGATNYMRVEIITGTSIVSLRVRVDPTPTLYLDAYVGSSSVATGTVSFTKDTWAHVQARIYIADSGGYIKTRIDGNTDIDYSGDTKSSTGSTITSVKFIAYNGIGGVYVWLDDIAFGTSDWPGDIRFDLLVPNDDTGTMTWDLISGSTAPTACTATASATAGNLNGDYYYKITFIDANGESALGSASNLVQPVSKRVDLTSIQTGPAGTTARRVYRTAAGGSDYFFVTEIANNTATTYTDDLADSGLGHEGPPAAWYQLAPVPPDDTDFIKSDTDGEQALMEMSDWDPAKKTPIAVISWFRAQKLDATATYIKPLLYVGSTLDTGSDITLLTSIAMYYKIYTTNPDTSLAWEPEEIDAMQIGVESQI